jgi:hypothetical protein
MAARIELIETQIERTISDLFTKRVNSSTKHYKVRSIQSQIYHIPSNKSIIYKSLARDNGIAYKTVYRRWQKNRQYIFW